MARETPSSSSGSSDLDSDVDVGGSMVNCTNAKVMQKFRDLLLVQFSKSMKESPELNDEQQRKISDRFGEIFDNILSSNLTVNGNPWAVPNGNNHEGQMPLDRSRINYYYDTLVPSLDQVTVETVTKRKRAPEICVEHLKAAHALEQTQLANYTVQLKRRKISKTAAAEVTEIKGVAAEKTAKGIFDGLADIGKSLDSTIEEINQLEAMKSVFKAPLLDDTTEEGGPHKCDAKSAASLRPKVSPARRPGCTSVLHQWEEDVQETVVGQ